MTDSQFQTIMDRLDRIEGAVALAISPSKSLDIKKKALLLRKAIASGDKTEIKQARRLINEK